MKKLIASAGLVAVGAVGLNAQYAPGLSRMETTKPWSVSASLRGFYDDNYNTAPSTSVPGQPEKEGSWGIEFSPAVYLNMPMEQTLLRLGYIYSLRYYEARPDNNVDQGHQFNASLEHRLSERFKLSFDDSFVYSVEPEIIDPTGSVVRKGERANADAIRNFGNILFSSQLTDPLSLDVGYNNGYFNYLDDGNFTYSASLDRVQHLFILEPRYRIQENLLGMVGYHFGINDYTSSDAIAFTTSGEEIKGEDRSNTFHDFYLGVEYALSSQLTADVRGGGAYYTYDNSGSEDGFSPYADMSATYTYLPGSYTRGGFRYQRNATDFISSDAITNPDDVVMDATAATVYGQVVHRITPFLTGSILLSFQNAVFNGGSNDGDAENSYRAGADLEYKFSDHFSGDVGYNFDRLDSDIGGRSFSRNRVFVGVRANY